MTQTITKIDANTLLISEPQPDSKTIISREELNRRITVTQEALDKFKEQLNMLDAK